MSPRTLSSHLDRMYKQKKIDRGPIQIGRPRYYWLTDETLLEMEFGYSEAVKSNRNRKVIHREYDSEEGVVKIIVRLILRRCALGIEKLGKPIPISKLPQGTHRAPIVYTKDVYYEPVFLDGFSTEDLVNSTDFVDQLMFKRKFNGDKIGSIIAKFRAKEPPIIRPRSMNGDVLYSICDDLLKKFIGYSEVVFGYVIIRMYKAWSCRRPSTGEVDWYESIFGQKETTEFFLNLEKEKEKTREFSREKGNYKIQSKKNLKKQIKDWDNHIKSLVYVLDRGMEFDAIRNSKYTNYRVFSKFFLQESYPDFLKVLHATNQI